MFDRTRVTSGFDIEALVSERYLAYIILAQIEAGRLGTRFEVVDPDRDLDLSIELHPPTDYARHGYDPDPSVPLPVAIGNSMAVRLLPDGDEAFMQVTAFVSVENRTNGQLFSQQRAGLLLDVALDAETDDNGLEQAHEIVLSLVGFDAATRTVLDAVTDADQVEAALRPFVDRRIPLGIARGQRVRRVRIRRFVEGNRGSLGLYLDLALRDGPEADALLPPRGDVSQAQHFLPAGSDLAFSTSPGLFALAGPDLKFRQAEEDEDGNFSFPLRKNPRDPNSDKIGRIKKITVGPRLLQQGQGLPPVPTGELLIALKGEYTDALGDPDFTLSLIVDPKRKDGIVELDLDVKVDLGLLATLVLVAGGIALTFMFGPGVGLGSGLLVGSFLGLAVLRGLIAQPLAAKLIEDRIDEDTEASILDVLPFRVPAARRRWDPFYVTEHQLVALVDEITVDPQGFAFEAGDVKLAREPVPTSHVVLRDTRRDDDGRITALRYRVRDLAAIADDLAAQGPGRDSMDVAGVGSGADADLVDLTLAQTAERIGAGRLLGPITYTAERIHLVHNQIDHMLTISRRERGEAERTVINRFRAAQRERLLDALGGALLPVVTEQLQEELGREPTEEEIDEAVDAFLKPILDDMQALFEQGPFRELAEAEVLRRLRLELPPEHYVQLQQAGILLIDGKEIIVRHNADGTVTPYFRDRPDQDRTDNLLALPTYSPPFEPPD